VRYYYNSGFAEFKEAQRTYIRSSPGRRILFHLQMWGFLVLGLGALFLFSQMNSSGASGSAQAILVGGLVGAGVVFPLLRPWQIRRVYNANRGKEKEPRAIYVEVSDDLLVSGIDGESEGRFYRSAVCAVVEDAGMLLLFVKKKKFLYFRKSALPPGAEDAVRAWLALPGAPDKC
jgi:hypothetical protein